MRVTVVCSLSHYFFNIVYGHLGGYHPWDPTTLLNRLPKGIKNADWELAKKYMEMPTY